MQQVDNLDDAGGVTSLTVLSTTLRAGNTPSKCISVVVLVFRVSAACVQFCEPRRLDTFFANTNVDSSPAQKFLTTEQIYTCSAHELQTRRPDCGTEQ